MSKVSINQKYLNLLTKYPLLTKALTASILAVVNELIATIISKDFKSFKCKLTNSLIKHPISIKLPLLALFAALIQTPISHYYYNFINKLSKQPLSNRGRLLQLITTLLTLSPIQCTLAVSFISLLNLKPSPSIRSLIFKDEISRLKSTIVKALQDKLPSVLKSSWITTPIVLSICQNYLKPEYWVVFNNLIFFILGTGQNTYLKLKSKQDYENAKKREVIQKEIEKEVDEKEAESLPETL
ncbi:hypothetical protein WICMUC_001590 [Wickerhamomyces mucosus]|uniref:Peroxisomal membrane protein PMP22 n=1 Tax=Wickerhamomyces mucosus TaxID=1378264 RepID=A0A9P8PVT6_9ASCO|nr:hypothetical protein WICMUC_001590 [Wickerhamomyces mucosus]